MSDWKLGYCASNIFQNKDKCCNKSQSGGTSHANQESCLAWQAWTLDYWGAFALFIAFALLFGIISCTATLTTKTTLPVATPGHGDKQQDLAGNVPHVVAGKSMYLAAGSGIPEIKTILSGFVIPDFLDFKVLAVKAFGAVFAVATGMCLGKEGPFVHISTCVAYLVGMQFPKYRENSRKMRELLSAGCASGLSVAFGAPIGGVLFAYEVNRPVNILTLYTHIRRKLVHTFLARCCGGPFCVRYLLPSFSKHSIRPVQESLPSSRPTMALLTSRSTTWSSYFLGLQVVCLEGFSAKPISCGRRAFESTTSSRITLF